MEASSPAEVRRRLQAHGCTVTKVRRQTRVEFAATADPAPRLVQIIVAEAVKAQAEVARVALAPDTGGPTTEARTQVWYRVAGEWHQVMSLPGQLWVPLRAQLEKAGLKMVTWGEDEVTFEVN